MREFIIVDTEGRDYLREIAVIDQTGQLCYEAFTQELIAPETVKPTIKPLKQILLEFFAIARNKEIICHLAKHDLAVINQSCTKVGIKLPALNLTCSVQLAQYYYPHLPSHSLGYLSKKLGLKVNRKYFNPEQAHTARYDALFTYQLYCKILEKKKMNQLQLTTNPFASNRVDNPFQDHVDLKPIHQNEFERLKWIITDIKQDKNHQSRGTVVIGEPGSGKTHLMMRLAKELLKVNRLLFIRCPNNADSVLFHIYSRILESFVEKIPETGYTQLETLLAQSFVKLISRTGMMTLTQKDQDILSIIKENPLNIYEQLGAEGSGKKLDYWRHIEKRTDEWWMSEYGLAGYASQIIKGIIKYCSYSKPHLKKLVTRWLAAEELNEIELEAIGLNNWNEEMSKEAFSLEAISVFSKLSLLDEPLIIIFDQLEVLGLKHNEQLLFAFGEAVKEIFTHVSNSLVILNLFPDRWEQFKEKFDGAIIDRVSQNQLYLQRPSDQYLTEILRIKAKSVELSLETLFTATELETILNHNSIRAILNSASNYYYYKVHQIPLPQEFSLGSVSKVSENIENVSDLETRINRLENHFQQFQSLFQQMGKLLSEFTLTDLTSSRIPHQNSTNSIANSIFSQINRFIEQNRPLFEQEYEKLQIINDSDDLGKFLEIAEAFKTQSSYVIDFLSLGRKKIPEHCVIQYTDQSFAIAFLQLDGSTFTNRIKNFNELVIHHKDIQFQLWRDARKDPITGKIGKEEIERLNNSQHGSFNILTKEDRINFELIYKLITDIHNRDLDMELELALPHFAVIFQDSWIIKILIE
ncbi:MAG: exonuclease domain-containing protein [Snowella sp.]|nr:exonuclease domain-containing protein [Snowella sp.]